MARSQQEKFRIATKRVRARGIKPFTKKFGTAVKKELKKMR